MPPYHWPRAHSSHHASHTTPQAETSTITHSHTHIHSPTHTHIHIHTFCPGFLRFSLSLCSLLLPPFLYAFPSLPPSPPPPLPSPTTYLAQFALRNVISMPRPYSVPPSTSPLETPPSTPTPPPLLPPLGGLRVRLHSRTPWLVISQSSPYYNTERKCMGGVWDGRVEVSERLLLA